MLATMLTVSKHESQSNLFFIAVVLLSNGNFIFTVRDVCDKRTWKLENVDSFCSETLNIWHVHNDKFD